jgi:hypothetical protein
VTSSPAPIVAPVEDVETALRALIAVGSAIAEAVERRDLAALERATHEAEGLTASIPAAIAARSAPNARPVAAEIASLAEEARSRARRTAMLIEHAWSIDAATLRLLAGIGRASGATTGYVAAAPAPHLERRA